VLVVVEFDPVTADIHGDRFPSVTVLVYELGNSTDDAIGEILRFAPRSVWPSLAPNTPVFTYDKPTSHHYNQPLHAPAPQRKNSAL
jgi:hypothetical protein